MSGDTNGPSKKVRLGKDEECWHQYWSTCCFFHEAESVTDVNLRNESVDLSDKEMELCIRIYNTLKPYIPKKNYRFIIGYQLPFCMLTNDIIRITSHSKFTRKLFPKAHFSSFDALQLNAPSLYQILTGSQNPLCISDFQNSKIESVDYARSNKDVVFSSIFDLETVYTTCSSYDLQFDHTITIVPGMKIARLLGISKNCNSPSPCLSKPSYAKSS
jgi:hypothetical protein